MKFEHRDQLRQSLLELHYDLLDEQQAKTLRDAIETDPEVAAEWAATLRLAGKLADAANFKTASLPDVNLSSLTEQTGFEPSSNGSGSSGDHPIMARVVEDDLPDSSEKVASSDTAESFDTAASQRVTRAGKWNGWIGSTWLAATAAAIGMLVIGSWYVERLPSKPMAVVRVQAEPVLAPSARSENEFRFRTTRLDASTSSVGGFAVTPASLSFSVLASNHVLFCGTAETGSDGSGRITLPPSLVIPKDARLHVTARSIDGGLSESSIEVPLEPTRCLTYVTIDRPVYRPGETVYFRSLTLQRRSLRVNSDVPIRFELIDPSGAVVPGAFLEGVTDRGVGNGSFTIPSNAPGGPYTLVAKSLDGFFPEERCKFQVRAYRVPRFKKELEFRRRSYGPGDTVEADFSATRAEGGPLAGAAVVITATVDDTVIHQATSTTSPSGTCTASFTLPTLISKGAGQLSIAIDDGGTRETQSKTIPIHLGRVAVEFFPEGGYLVDGLPNRVYFTARDSLGTPIHLAGEVLNRSGQSVAAVETTRDGMGRFKFVPVRGERYTLKVTNPVDVTNNPSLPSVVKDLPVIDTGSGVFDARQPINMVIRSTKALRVVARAVCRGALVGEQVTDLVAGDNSLSMPIRDDAGGVVRVTIFDAGTMPPQPLVERLVYRRQEQQLQVEIVDGASALQRSPGQPLRLNLQVRDETGEPAPAVLGVSVVDDAALSLEESERPRLQTHFLLTSEVQKPEDLEHANFYLSNDPEAALSLDLLLGTQGWRRFVSGSSSQPNVDFRQQLIRLLELDGNGPASRPESFDNAGRFSQSWLRYRDAARLAWQQLLVEARILMLVVLFLWLMTILFHLRRHARLNLAAWLLVASTSLFVYGCGAAPETGMVVSDSSRQNAATRKFAEKAIESEAEPMASAEPTEPGERSLPSAGSGAKDESGLSIEALQEGLLDLAKYGVSGWDDDTPMDRHGSSTTSSGSPGSPGSRRLISKSDLERLLAARGLDAEALADQLIDELRFPIRQYAHRHVGGEGQVRRDFAETLFWHPMLITDSEGRADIRFDLSDSVTSFHVNVDGHSMDGRIGSGDVDITSRLPFQVEPKLPLEVTAGDRIDLPIAVINTTDGDAKVAISLTADASLQPRGETSRVLQLAADERRREHIALDVVAGSAERDAVIEIRGVGPDSLSDSVRRSIHVSPAGYPASQSAAGRLSGRGKVRLPIPKEIVPGSLGVTLRAYPSPIADVMSGVESILSEPNGCFEQASATNYPNAMALLYLKQTQTADPQVSRRALGMLDRGYQKLTSFECQHRGYEWFGSDPGHEALSAFGLMQFTDMSQVMAISDEMLVRTRQWLLGRRDGNGGFQRNPRHLHVWSVQQPIVNAYVLWAITEADVAAGQPLRAAGELASELDELNRVAMDSRDPYLVALSAAALMNVKRLDDGEKLLQKLAELQTEDGSLQGETTVTSSGGLSLTMETTALATLAWAKSPRFLPQAQAAAQWIAGNRLGNAGFGSTQATVLALKALVAMAEHSQSRASGLLQVQLDGEVIGQATLPDSRGSGSTVEIQGLGAKLQNALNSGRELELQLVAPQAKNLSYTIDASYHVTTPSSCEECPVKLATKITGDFAEDGTVESGQILKVEASLTNRSAEGQPMTVAILGLPGGVEPRVQELDELQVGGRFDYYEIRGRDIVFYWRTVEPNAVNQVEFHVTATIPGKYAGPASRAYLYYTAEQKDWAQPLGVEIKP